jgi:glycosyltransferase involved in cell wall biosynthesis
MTDKKIRLFVDAHCVDKASEGTHTFVCGLYNALAARYNNLDIYIGAYNVNRVLSLFPGIPRDHVLKYRFRKPAYLRFVWDIPAYLKKKGIQFAHFQYYGPRVGEVKSIITLHDVLYNEWKTAYPWPYRFIRHWLFGASIRKAAVKTTVSAYSQYRIASNYGIPVKEISVIPNAADLFCKQQHSSAEQAARLVKARYGISNFILCVSRIEPRKNHLLLLEQYLELKLYEKKIALVFIGVESVKVPALLKRLAQLTPEQSACFHWIRQVPQEDLAAFYQACRLFVYPSLAEGFGIPPLEAALSLAPVLCSSGGAMQQFSFFSPYLFNPLHKEDLRRKMMALLESPPSLAQRERLSATIRRTYSWEQSAALFHQLIQSNVCH